MSRSRKSILCLDFDGVTAAFLTRPCQALSISCALGSAGLGTWERTNGENLANG
jgi:hypothetical protein